MGQVRQDTIQLTVEINGQKAGSTLKELRQTARSLGLELDHLVPGTEAFIKKAAELKAVKDKYAAVQAQTRGVANEMDNAGKRINPLTELFKKGAAAAAGFFAVENLARWGKEFASWVIKGTAALEDMEDKIRRTFGDAIDIVDDFAKINAQSLGKTETEYKSLAASIAAILIPMGFSREAAAKMSSQIVNLSGVLSEWTNGTKSAADVNGILSKALLGQTKGLVELGIAIKDTDVKSRLAAQGQDKLVGSALAQAKAQATLQLILEKSKDAQVEFAASAQDISRSEGRLLAFFNQVKENILNQYLPSIKKATSALANLFTPPAQESDLIQKRLDKFNVLIRTLQAGNAGHDGELKIIKQLKEEYPEYLKDLDLENASFDQLNTLLKSTNDQLLQKIKIQRVRETKFDLLKQQDENEEERKALAEKIELEKQNLKLTEESGRSIKNSSAQGIKNRIKSLEDQVSELVRQKFNILGEIAKADKELLKLGIDPVAEAKAKAIADTKAADDLAKLLAEQDRLAKEEQRKKDEAAAEAARQARFHKAEESIKIEEQLKLSSLDKALLSDKEYNFKKQIIDLETEIETNAAKLKYLKLAESDRLNIIRTNRNDEHKIEELNQQISLAGLTDFFNHEKELRSQFAIATIKDANKLNAQLELIELQRQQKENIAKLAHAKPSEVAELNTAILKNQKDIDKLLLKISVDDTVASLKVKELKEIEASNALGKKLRINEEEQGKERLRIHLFYERLILEEQLKLADPGSPEQTAIRTKLEENARQQAAIIFTASPPPGGVTDQADTDRRKKHLDQLKDAAISSAHEIANAEFTIASNRIEQQLQRELDAIDKVEQRKIAAAGDDVVLQKKAHAEADRDRLAAEKKAARERKKIAREEAVVQGALAIVEALPNVFAAAAAAVATAFQLSVIDSQTFAKGGFTGRKGLYKDNTGQEVAGVVHAKEWVAPRHLVEDPETGPVISYLERVRKSKGGFADGGFTTVSTTPTGFTQTVTSNAGSNELKQIRDLLQSIDQKVGSWPRTLKAFVSLTELEAKQKEIGYIRDQASV